MNQNHKPSFGNAEKKFTQLLSFETLAGNIYKNGPDEEEEDDQSDSAGAAAG